MSVQSHISLIDLSKQFRFDIDEDIKKKICFAETLIVSCGPNEGELKEDSSESDWSCSDSTGSKVTDKDKDKDEEIEQTKDEHSEKAPESYSVAEERDFHFYFFPDCSEPAPSRGSLASCITVDGFPKINPDLYKEKEQCTCKINRNGECPCHFKVPCRCGAKKRADCMCLQAENICICDEGKPQIVCKCKPSDVCLCHDGKPRPFCICNQVGRPCICEPGKYPRPVCACERKPNIENNPYYKDVIEEEKLGEEEMAEMDESIPMIIPKEPCTCQTLLPGATCYCLKGKECLCKPGECSCGVPPTCICEPSGSGEIACKDDDSKTVCVCPVEQVCTCDTKSSDACECFPEPVECACDNPEGCTCGTTCDCVPPCMCNLVQKKKDICTCDENRTEIAGSLLCTCPPKKQEVTKLKRVRAAKHGYRWCPDVDPRHNYFGYSYDKHDKISYKEQEKEKLKILGLYEETTPTEGPCPIHGSQPVIPEFKKKVRKPSLDCCSSVGGISISVETLGEDKGKFLVQVVSHASKEGAKTGSKLVSIMDCNLHTLEENKIEHITKKDLTKEQRSYMTICESGYYNKVTRICGERHYVKRLYHSFDDARNFLLEGANVVLLRYIGISRYCGHIKTDTVLIDGTICESIYVSLGVSQAIVNGKPLFVVKVERHIIEPSGFIHQTLTVLTLRGYMVSHEWADTSYIFHINPLLRVVPEKDEIEPHEPLREHWRSDLQLLSDYLDHKSTRSSEGAKYVTENGELTGLIRDYLQTLLLLRPQDALEFTRNYFGSTLSALDLPHDEYFDSCSRRVRYYFFEE